MFIPAAAITGALAVAGCPAILSWRPLAYVGKISYGLYLWHGLVIWWHLPWPVAVPLSIAMAIVSFHVIEQPFLGLKDRFGRPRKTADPASAPSAQPTVDPLAEPA